MSGDLIPEEAVRAAMEQVRAGELLAADDNDDRASRLYAQAEQSAVYAAEAAAALDKWLSNGGALPDAWASDSSVVTP